MPANEYKNYKYPKNLIEQSNQGILDVLVEILTGKTLDLTDVDLNLLLQTAKSQKILNRLIFCIISDDYLTEKFLSNYTELKNHYLRDFAAYTLIEEEFFKIFADFEETGLRVFPFKGCAIWLLFNLKPLFRELTDLDLLCRKQDLKQIARILNKHGYFESDEPNLRWFNRIRGIHLNFHLKERSGTIEIHHHLYDEQPENIVNVITDTQNNLKIRHIQIPMLSYEDLIIISAHHFFLELETMDLRRLFDFYLYLKDYEDFETLEARAIEVWNEPLTLLLMLKTSQRIFGFAFPQDIELKLAKSLKNPEKKIYLKFLESGFASVNKVSISFAIWKSRKQGRRERSILRILFPMPGLLVNEYKVPRASKFFLFYRLKYCFYRLTSALIGFLKS